MTHLTALRVLSGSHVKAVVKPVADRLAVPFHPSAGIVAPLDELFGAIDELFFHDVPPPLDDA
jgi:hypothetical protein